MINSILTNMASLNLQNNLNSSQKSISTSLKRMSSGLKINSAKDNVADYSISQKMGLNISGMNIAMQNAKHGVNLLDIADDTLNNMVKKLTKIRDRSLEIMNSGHSYEEKMAIQEEVDQLVAEIVREKDTAVYNEKNIFGVEKTEILDENVVNGIYAYEVEYVESKGGIGIDTGFVCNKDDNYSYTMTGDFRNTSNCWVGANAFLQLNFKDNTVSTGTGKAVELNGSDTITCSYKNQTESMNVNGEDISSRNWSSYTGKDVRIGIFRLGSNNDSWHGATAAKGKLSSYQLYKDDELVLDLKPVVDNNGVACMFDNISKELFYSSSGTLQAGPKIIKEPEFLENPYSVSLQIGEDVGSENYIDIELGFNLTNFVCDVITQESAQKTLKRVDELIEILSSKRVNIASMANRLNSIQKIQEKEMENLQTSNSLLVDADMAKESLSFAKSQILQEISTALFSQSNLINSNLALKLLYN